jgi:hypothetical protein
LRKTPIFSLKLAKIAENCDHNIGPCSTPWASWFGNDRQKIKCWNKSADLLTYVPTLNLCNTFLFMYKYACIFRDLRKMFIYKVCECIENYSEKNHNKLWHISRSSSRVVGWTILCLKWSTVPWKSFSRRLAEIQWAFLIIKFLKCKVNFWGKESSNLTKIYFLKSCLA